MREALAAETENSANRGPRGTSSRRGCKNGNGEGIRDGGMGSWRTESREGGSVSLCIERDIIFNKINYM